MLSFSYKLLLLLTNPLFYLFNMIPRKNTSRPTWGSDNIPLLGTKHNFFQNCYFPAAIMECNRLDIDIWKSYSISIFKKRILSQTKPQILTIHKDSNSWQGCNWVSVICAIINPSIIFWIPFIHFVAVALISKQLFIFFPTAQTLWNTETPFWEKFLKLIVSW